MSLEAWIYQVDKLRLQLLLLEPPLTDLEQVVPGVHFLENDALNWWVNLELGMVEETQPMIESWQQFEDFCGKGSFLQMQNLRLDKSLYDSDKKAASGIMIRSFKPCCRLVGGRCPKVTSCFNILVVCSFISRKKFARINQKILEAMEIVGRCGDYYQQDNNQ